MLLQLELDEDQSSPADCLVAFECTFMLRNLQRSIQKKMRLPQKLQSSQSLMVTL